MKKIDEGLMRKYLDREMARGFKGEKWEKYFRGKIAWLVELTDGTIYAIEKENIETRFCFGESGYDFDDAMNAADRARTDEEWFKAENLKKIDNKLDLLEKKGKERGVWHIGDDLFLAPDADVVEDFYTIRYWSFDESKYRRIEREDRDRLIEGYKLVREDFSKRIDNYLKRYGLSKVYSWTYWRDA